MMASAKKTSRQHRRMSSKMPTRELVGRQQEVSTLQNCFERMVKAKRSNSMNFDANFESNRFVVSTVHKELVLIRGKSGVGKTSLAKSIRSGVDEAENGIFVEGKFDLITSNEPYSGVAKAFGTICRELTSSSKQSMAAVGRMISNELRDEVQTLLPLIPELKDIISANTSPKTTPYSTKEKHDLDRRQERWKHAFRRLSRALNAAFSPLILFLDDLQWADVSSLQVWIQKRGPFNVDNDT